MTYMWCRCTCGVGVLTCGVGVLTCGVGVHEV